MVFNILTLTEQQSYIFIIISAVILFVILILIIAESRLKKRLFMSKNKNKFYEERISEIIKSKDSPEKKLESINVIAREFFTDVFNLSRSLEYTEISAILKRRKVKYGEKFCNEIILARYSGEKLQRKTLNQIISLLLYLIRKNRILTPEQKAEIERRKMKKLNESGYFKFTKKTISAIKSKKEELSRKIKHLTNKKEERKREKKKLIKLSEKLNKVFYLTSHDSDLDLSKRKNKLFYAPEYEGRDRESIIAQNLNKILRSHKKSKLPGHKQASALNEQNPIIRESENRITKIIENQINSSNSIDQLRTQEESSNLKNIGGFDILDRIQEKIEKRRGKIEKSEGLI